MFCDKCEKELLEADGEIQGGKCLKFKDGDYEYFVIRCDECFAKDTSLRNYQENEGVSREVGYMRPVQQWHKGKQQEYKERKEFAIQSSD